MGGANNYYNLLTTSFVNVWFGDDHINFPEWTMSVELWGSFLVYLSAISFYKYKHRYAIYTVEIVFFLVAESCVAKADKYDPYVMGHGGFRYYMALFLIGLFMADLENAKDWGENHSQRPF